jgi:hypothetical protein
MSAHNLSIFIQKINKAIKAQLSPHDGGKVKVSRILSIVHYMDGIMPQSRGKLPRSFEYRTAIVRATKGAQVVVQ